MLVGEVLSEERGPLSKAKFVGAGNGSGRIRPGNTMGAVGAIGAVVDGDGERLVVGGGLRERSSKEARRRQYIKPRGVRLSTVGDVDATPGLSPRGGEAMTLTRSGGGGGFDGGEDSAPTMESMLKASFGLLLLEEQLTPEAEDAVEADADVELTDTTKGFVGAIGSMLNV